MSIMLSNSIALAEDVVKPAEMSKSDIAGGIYLRPDMTRVTHPDGSNALDVTNFTSCLLYTSPSPRDLSTSRMPSSA